MADDTLIVLSYSKRDIDDVLTFLKQQLPEYTDQQWTDFLNSDIGYALVKAFVVLGDKDCLFADQNLSEAFLSLARQRESVVRIAKALNYPISRALSASCEVALSFPSFGSEVDIPANSTWSINGVSFVCLDPIIIPAGQTSQNISLVQGSPYTSTFTASGADWFAVFIPNNASQIVISVNGTPWNEVDTWIGVTDPQSFKLSEDPGGQLRIQFEANINAYAPLAGDIISCSALLTDGTDGNIELANIPVRAVSIIRDQANNDITSSFSGTSVTAALGGADVEDIDSIRANAPAFYSTQGRCVTASDYDAVVRAIPGVQDCKIIGGETIGQYGTVLCIVYGATPYSVTQDLLNEVQAELALKGMITVIPNVVAPTVVEFALSLTAGLISGSFADSATARNLINTALTTFFSTLKIGDSVYLSDLLSVVQAISGIKYLNYTTSLVSYGSSLSNIVSIELISNPDLTNCTLLDDSGNILFTGDGTQYAINGNFVFTASSLTDQACSLDYISSTPDVLLTYNEIAVLISTTIDTLIAQ